MLQPVPQAACTGTQPYANFALVLGVLWRSRCTRSSREGGLGKTLLAKNLVHQAILAGHSARLVTAADLILDLTSQDTARALQRRLRSYLRPSLLAIDEVGYLAYDPHAADLLFQVVSRRYEQKSIVITTNLPFKNGIPSSRMWPVPWP
jgi:hypothetical protein